MDAVFTLPYPEHAVAERLSRLLPKKDGYSVHLPLSRQQQGMDLLVYFQHSRRAATIQVKSSRSFPGTPSKRQGIRRFKHYLWFNNFDNRLGDADFYVLFGLYPRADVDRRRLDKARKLEKWWAHIMLMFPAAEMQKFLNGVKTKSGARDRFFGFGFDAEAKEIFCNRGPLGPYGSFLIDRRIGDLKGFLK